MNQHKIEQNPGSPKSPKIKNEIWEEKRRRINEKQLTHLKLNALHLPESPDRKAFFKFLQKMEDSWLL